MTQGFDLLADADFLGLGCRLCDDQYHRTGSGIDSLPPPCRVLMTLTPTSQPRCRDSGLEDGEQTLCPAPPVEYVGHWYNPDADLDLYISSPDFIHFSPGLDFSNHVHVWVYILPTQLMWARS